MYEQAHHLGSTSSYLLYNTCSYYWNRQNESKCCLLRMEKKGLGTAKTQLLKKYTESKYL